MKFRKRQGDRETRKAGAGSGEGRVGRTSWGGRKFEEDRSRAWGGGKTEHQKSQEEEPRSAPHLSRGIR